MSDDVAAGTYSGEGTMYAITAVMSQFDVGAETLLRYERAGLLRPKIVNDVRFYTSLDIERLSTIQRLTEICGINLAGVDVVLRLLDEIETLKRQLD